VNVERRNVMDRKVVSRARTSTVRIVAHSSLSPERVLAAGYDFSPRRGKGRLFGFAFRHFGDKLFGKYVREIIDNTEQSA
jgi:hypothetical protein